jgi:hypothetical protein
VRRYGWIVGCCVVAAAALYVVAVAGVGESANPVADTAGLASVALLGVAVVVSALAVVRSFRGH